MEEKEVHLRDVLKRVTKIVIVDDAREWSGEDFEEATEETKTGNG